MINVSKLELGLKLDLLKDDDDNIKKAKNDKENEYSERQSLLLNIFSQFLFGFSGFSAKLLGIHFPESFCPNNFIMTRSIGMILFSLLNFKIKNIEIPKFEHVVDKKWLIIRCITNYFAFTTWILGLYYFRFTTMACFNRIAPVFIMICSVLILKEKFHMKYLYGILICLLGSFIIIINDMSSDNNLLNQVKNENESSRFNRIINGLICGLSFIIFIAVTQTSTKQLVNSGIEPHTVIFYVGICGFILGFISNLFIFGRMKDLLNVKLSLLTMINGVLFYYASTINQTSLKSLDLIKTTTISYFSIVQAFVLGYVFLNEKIGVTDIIGSLIIISYNVYLTYTT